MKDDGEWICSAIFSLVGYSDNALSDYQHVCSCPNITDNLSILVTMLN